MPSQTGAVPQSALSNPVSAWAISNRLHICAAMVPGRASKILDVACGEGHFERIFLSSRNASIHGVDLCAENIASAKRLVPRAKFQKADAESLPFNSGTFDLVVAFEALEHFKDADSAMREMLRVLRKGGELLVSVPDEGNPMWKLIWAVWSRTFGRRWFGKHEREFDYASLRAFLARHGLEVLETRRALLGCCIIMRARKAGRPCRTPRNAMATGWSAYWKTTGRSPLASIYRTHFVRPVATRACDSLFPEKGSFAELGCGSGESSAAIPRKRRRFIGVDIDPSALVLARNGRFYDKLVAADIRKLPFKRGSMDGVWNIGMMEHFTKGELRGVMIEAARVLKKGGVAVFFWPRKFGLVTFAVNAYDLLSAVLWGRNVFPPHYTFYERRAGIEKIALESGFHSCSATVTWRDIFQNAILVAKK